MNTALVQRGVGVGLVLVGAGAMLFACKGLFAKALFAHGVSSEAMVAIRALIALPFFCAFAWYSTDRTTAVRPSRAAMLGAIVAGLLCYYVGALCSFRALSLIDASIERTLLFAYPAFVVFATAALERQRPVPSVLVAVALTWFGIFMSAGGFDRSELLANAEGATLAILSGLTYGGYFMIAARYTREIGSARFTMYAMSASTAALTLHLLLTNGFGRLSQYDATAWLLLIGIGTVSMALPALLQAEGLRRAGAVRSAVVTTVGPPTTALLAYWLLGERLSAWQILGMVFIVGGILLLERQRLAAVSATDA